MNVGAGPESDRLSFQRPAFCAEFVTAFVVQQVISLVNSRTSKHAQWIIGIWTVCKRIGLQSINKNRLTVDGTISFFLFVLIWKLTVVAVSAAESDGFPEADQDFNAYVLAAKRYIAQNQLQHRQPLAVEINAPFEITADPTVPYRGRFLLFHGLNDSPFVWRDMAQSLSTLGFDVRAVLLPGHGTTPEAMLDVSYRQWLSAARDHLTNWHSDDVALYVGGFSLGGVIATILALENPHIAGLFLVSPAYHSKLNHLLRWAWLYQQFKPWVFGGMIIEDNPAKYNSIPINSTTQYFNTSRYLKHRWRRRTLDMPVVMVATAKDSVVDVDYSRNIYRKRMVSDNKRFILYTNDTSIDLRSTEIHRFSRHLDLRVLNQSHLSLINHADNPLFGQSRRILVCNGNTPDIFFGCMRSDNHWFGAQHTPSPDGTAVARTTYNPDYEFIVEQIDQVFGK